MVRLFLISIFSLVSSLAMASNQVMTYQGILTNSSDEPITTAQTVTFSILSPAPASCLLYREDQTIVPDSKGRFTAKIGSGTRNDGLGHAFIKVFMNGGSFTGLSCANSDTSYTPAASDNRVLSIKVNGTTLSPLVDINSVPFAMQAQEVSGWGINNLVKVHPTTGSPSTFTANEMTRARELAGATCATGEILKWNGSQWACAPDVSGGAAPGNADYGAANKGLVAFDTSAATSGITVTSGVAKLSSTGVSANTYGSAAAVASFTVDAQGRLTAASSIPIALLPSQIAQGGANSGEVLKWNGTAWVPSADATGGTPSDSSYTGKGIVQFDTNAATSGVTIASGLAKVNTGVGANQIVKLDASGKLPAVDGSALTNINIGNANSGTLQVDRGGTGATAFTANALVMTNGTGTALGSITCGPGQILKWNGTTWGCDTDLTGTSPGDGSYAAKGLLQGLTDATTSGLNISAGVVSVNAGTGANQIVKLDGNGKLPALDGSALTNVTVSNFSGVLPVANGGTNSNTALNNNRLMISSGGKIVEAPEMTNGQIMVGSTGAAPAVATLGTNGGISITAGAGTLTVGSNATAANTVSTIVARNSAGDFAAGAVTNTSNILKGSTSGTLTMTVPATVTSYTLTWPAAVGGAGSFLTTDASGNLSWGSPAAISDASYAAKGAVQGLTDAATSGLNIASGVISVNSGTGANQIVKLNGSAQLPAVDGSAVTNLNPNNLSVAVPISKGGTGQTTAGGAFNALSPLTTKGDLLTRDGSNHVRLPAGSNGQVLSADSAEASGLKWISPPTGSVTGVTAGTGLLMGTTAGGTISSSGTLNVNVGTGANQIVQLEASSKLPPVDGSLLTNLSAANISAGILPIARGGTNSGAALANNKVMVSSSGAIVEGLGFGSASAVSTFVTRDASGDFAARNITNNLNILKGSTSGSLTMSVPAAVTSYTLTWPSAVGAANTFLKTDASGGLTWSGIDGSSLTGLDAGNITAGTLPVARGGTGATTLAANGVLIGNGTSAVTSTTGTQYQVLRVATAGAAPTFGSLDLSQTAAVTGTLPVARGGTGITTTGATGTLLRSTGTSTAPAWTTPTNAGIFEKGGNSFGSHAAIGTNDAFALELKTNNTTWMTIAADGRVAIGTPPNGSDGPGDLRIGGELVVGNDNGPSNLSLWQTRIETNQSPSFVFGAGRNWSDLPLANDLLGSMVFMGAGGGPGARISGRAAQNMTVSNAASDLAFFTSSPGTITPTERLTIRSDGFVGIGTAGGGTSILDINGALTVRGMASDPGVAPTDQGRIYYNTTSDKFRVSVTGQSFTDLVTGSAVTGVTAGTGLFMNGTAGGTVSSTGTLSVNVGTGANQIVQLNGSAQIPAVSGALLTNLNPANLSSSVTVSKGGTGLASGTQGGIPYFNTTTSMASSGVLTQHAVVLGGGASAAPTVTNAGSAYSVLRVPSGGGAPAFGAIELAQSGAVNGTLAVGNGGTGLSTFAAGDLLYASGTAAISKLAIGASGRVLTSSGSAPQWTANLPVGSGGTGAGSFTANSLIVANGSGSALSSMVCTANGDVLQWNSVLSIWECSSGAGGAFATYAAHGLVRIKDDPTTAGLEVISGVLNVNYGTAANQIVKLDGSAKLPPVDGSSLSFPTLRAPSIHGATTASGSVTIESTTHATKGKVILQPNGGLVSVGSTSPLNLGDTFAVNKVNNAAFVGLNTYSTSSIGHSYLYFRKSNSNTENHGATVAGQILGAMEFFGNSGSDFKSGARIEAKQVFANNPSYPPTNLYFFTSSGDTGVTQRRMVIDYDGNVGIDTGEDGMVNRLEVRHDTAAAVMKVRNMVNNGYSAIDFAADADATTRMSVGYGNASIGNFMANAGFIGTTTGIDLSIKAGDQERIRVLSGGNVGVGISAPTHILHINGQGRATNSAWATTSDIRLKDIEGTYNYGLNEILNINTVRFRYKSDNPLKLPSDKTYVGIIAQELQKVIPEAIEQTSDGYLTVNNDPVHWAVVNAVQDLHGMCKANEAVVSSQGRKIASLENENSKIRSEMKKRDEVIQAQSLKINELEKRLEAIEKRLFRK